MSKISLTLEEQVQNFIDFVDVLCHTIDTLWEHLKSSWINTRDDTLGRQQSKNKEWISMDTLKKVRERKCKKMMQVTLSRNEITSALERR